MMNKKQLLEKTRLFVLDMDGTFYLGSQLLKGSLEFLSEVMISSFVMEHPIFASLRM